MGIVQFVTGTMTLLSSVSIERVKTLEPRRTFCGLRDGVGIDVLRGSKSTKKNSSNELNEEVELHGDGIKTWYQLEVMERVGQVC